jgi:hypothetical protein
MTQEEVSLQELQHLQENLSHTLVQALDEDEREFLLSMKRGEPEWSRLEIEYLNQFPALQWKLININKMGSAKSKAEFKRLQEILSN